MPALKADITANATPFRRTLDQIKGEVSKAGAEISNSFRSMFLGAIGAEALRRLVTEVFTDATKIRDTAKAYGVTVTEVQELAMAAEKAGVPLDTVLGHLTQFREEAEAKGINEVANQLGNMAGKADEAARRTEALARQGEHLKTFWNTLKAAVGGTIGALTFDLPNYLGALSGATSDEVLRKSLGDLSAIGGRSGRDLAGALRRSLAGNSLGGSIGSGGVDAFQRIGAFIPGAGATVEQNLQVIAQATQQTASNTAQIAATSTGTAGSMLANSQPRGLKF